MTLVPQLERELVELARRTALSTARRPRRLRPSLVVAIVLTAMALAAAALAASGLIGGGAPLHPPRGTARDPHSGLGVLQAGSARVLNIAVPDPAGGPPWGLRFVSTTRALGCLQAGRLVRGQIGVLGQDGAFSDDGRFHPLTRNYLAGGAGPFPCGTLDAHGHAFAAVVMSGAPASGLLNPSSSQRGCVAHRDHGPIGRRRNQPPVCPRADWRQLYFGMAGPEARSVTYAGPDGQLHTIRTVGEQGAYLIVLPASLQVRGFGQYTLLDGAGGGPIVRVHYRRGHDCRVRLPATAGQSRACPQVGAVRPPRPRLTRADVASPVTARIVEGRHGSSVVVQFTARVAVTDASAAYSVFVRYPGRAAGVNCGGGQGGPLLHDVRAGQRERFSIPTQGCRGRFTGTVSYTHGGTSGLPPVLPGKGALSVGKFSIDVR